MSGNDDREDSMTMSNGTNEIRHDEIVTESHWEYTVRDGDGDYWEEMRVAGGWDEHRILEWFEKEVDYVRRLRDEGHQWYPAEDYPEPLTIVKRHVRVTTECSNWEEA